MRLWIEIAISAQSPANFFHTKKVQIPLQKNAADSSACATPNTGYRTQIMPFYCDFNAGHSQTTFFVEMRTHATLEKDNEIFFSKKTDINRTKRTGVKNEIKTKDKIF